MEVLAVLAVDAASAALVAFVVVSLGRHLKISLCGDMVELVVPPPGLDQDLPRNKREALVLELRRLNRVPEEVFGTVVHFFARIPTDVPLSYLLDRVVLAGAAAGSALGVVAVGIAAAGRHLLTLLALDLADSGSLVGLVELSSYRLGNTAIATLGVGRGGH